MRAEHQTRVASFAAGNHVCKKKNTLPVEYHGKLKYLLCSMGNLEYLETPEIDLIRRKKLISNGTAYVDETALGLS